MGSAKPDKFEQGQRVKVMGNDGTGVVVEVSTWNAVNPGMGNTGICYLVECDTWPKGHWVGHAFVWAV